MLQTMRDKAQGWTAKIIIAVIVLIFAVFGLETLKFGGGDTPVATVDGEKITSSQLRQMTEQHRRLLMQQMGGQIDPSMIDDRILQKLALDNLVQSALLRAAAKQNGMIIPASLIDDNIRSIPVFQSDGKYQPELVTQYVQASGLSVARFRQLLKEELLIKQLSLGLTASEFVTPHEQETLNKLRYQTRDIAWMLLSAAQARAAVQLGAQDIEDFYEQNNSEFMEPEKIAVDYITLERDLLGKEVKIDEEQIRTLYETRMANRRQQAEQRTPVSMILLEVDDKADAQAPVLEKARKLHTQLREGADFAALARQFSEDQESAREGGNIGPVESGVFGQSFDDAMASLAPGGLSEPFVSDYGVIILKRGHKIADKLPTLEQLRPAMEKQLHSQAVDALFADKARQLADISFEAADLNQPAEQLELPIEHTRLFGRTGSRKGLARHPQVVAAAFSEDVLDQGHNSKPVEVDKDTLVVVHLRERIAAKPKPLKSVQADIEKRLRAERAAQQLQQRAQQLVAGLTAGDNPGEQPPEQWTEAEKVRRDQPRQKLAPQIIAEAFRLPHPTTTRPSYGFTPLKNGDIAVVRVSQVTPGTPPARSGALADARQLRARGNDLFAAYLQALQDKADIQTKTGS